MSSDSLYVVFKSPEEIPSGAHVLSFLSAAEDNEISSNDINYYSGRELLEEIRSEAREIYRSCLIRPFAIPIGLSRKTLRQRMLSKYGVSLWWYHSASQKSTVEPGFVYTDTIQLKCIDVLAQRLKSDRIVLVGAPDEHYHCLKRKYEIIVCSGKSSGEAKEYKKIFIRFRFWKNIVKERFYLMKENLFVVRSLSRLASEKAAKYHLLLQAYWPWSMQDDGVTDKYFCRLPEKLQQSGKKVGYLYTVDFRRTIKQTDLESLNRVQSGIFIESYYSKLEVLLYTLDFKPLILFWLYSRKKKFRELFVFDDIDYWPLHRSLLLYGFLSFDIIRSRLRESALVRLLKKVQPEAIGTFLEFFIESRPVYAASEYVGKNIFTFAVQHAIVNADKAFDYIDGEYEIHGKPEGIVCPNPNAVFAMSQFTVELWKLYGYPEGQLFNTGGLRYEHVKIGRRTFGGVSPNILLVASMNNYQDFDMALACFEATRTLPCSRIRFRDHPHMRTSDVPQFQALKQRIQVSSASLEDDLAWADLVVFAHSTVAEEAIVTGMPVWQWVWPGCQASALYDYGKILKFTSVKDLEQALQHFTENPKFYAPSPELQDAIVADFFGHTPAEAAQRVTDILETKLLR